MPQNPLPPLAHASSPSGPSFDRPVRHFNQTDLSRRWKLSARTLERWRWQKIGPTYLKVGGRVIYRLEDVEAFETSRLQQPAPAIIKSSN